VAWRERGRHHAAGSVWSYLLLRRTPTFHPWLATVVLLGGLALAGLLAAWSHLPGRIGPSVAAATLAVALAGSASYTVATVSTPHGGAIPTAGPAGAGGGPRGAGGPAGFRGGGAAFAGGSRPVPGGGGFPGGGGGGVGGLLNGSTPSAALTALLQQGSNR
jgi:hypothetical protein